ncbi:hypothetical protein N0V93_008693 [Gnomoniopsis smithogilvyi]|uniref:Polyketide synthase n=1 Tax=Gnomoniopsis smithogilvyi TaxID=1191159 RepID=A0A9W8YPM1_9PEZI|nr:hypothetical protein N0V93_008693 [Gnomoniopsis smithogilvyi]
MSAKSPYLEPIAIIGTACRFPGGANSPSQLWEILRNPPDLAERIPVDRFDVEGFYSQNGQYHGHANVKEGYFLTGDGVTRRFDAPFFGMSPAEAMCLDPQCRLSLETVYEALESAGLTIESLRGSDTAVYAGQMVYDYEQIVTRDSDASLGIYHASGTSHAVTSNRISYFFDWHGPSMTIDTACSSSLVAFHHAVLQLRSGLSGVAVATGVNLLLDPGCFISLSSLNMLSPDGRSRMWSADANGYARGEGIAAVVLKPLSAALRDGDGIECIVRETGFVQDGRTPGIISPNAAAQVQLIRGCYERAGLDLADPANRPQFFECHGTGTQAGDTAEAEAISTAFSLAAGVVEGEPLKVGSIKTVIGHTEGAAGLAGIIKASLALQNTTFPPNLLFDRLNPRIKKFYANLQVSTTAATWPTPVGAARRASVNSFGFAGANAHAVLESYTSELGQPRPPTSLTTEVFTPFVFSASSETSLLRYISELRQYLLKNAENVSLRDLSYTLYNRRSFLQVTTSITASDAHDLCTKIEIKLQGSKEGNSQHTLTRALRRHDGGGPSTLVVFTGQGAQWAGMVSSLITTSLAARRKIEYLEARLSKLPEAHRPAWSLTEELLDVSSLRIHEASFSQPLCTAVQILQVDILREAGIKFSAVVGHSSGEIAAAYAVGLISAEDAICIAYYRGLSTELGAKGGAMVAVGTTAADAQELLDDPWLNGRVCLAAINSPGSLTLSGDSDAIDHMKVIFDDEHKFARRLKVDTAYHSHHMSHCSASYLQFLQDLNIQLCPGNSAAWFSSVFNGESMSTKEEQLKGAYWDRNMVMPVMFKQAIEQAYTTNGPFDMIIEVGPHPALKAPTLQTLQEISSQDQFFYTSLLRREVSAIESVADGLGYVWSLLGSKTVNLKGYDKYVSGDTVLRLAKGLPSYSWDHQNEYWNESRYSRAIRQREAVHELLGHVTPDSTDQDIRWRHILKPAEIPWLMGHLLQDQIVFPAAGYLATALEAAMGACHRRNVSPCMIELLDFEFGKALVFDHESSDAEIIVSLADIVSRSPKLLEANFKYHAGDARICLGDHSVDVLPTRAPRPYNLTKIRESNYYAASRDLGYQWAGPFVALDKCWRKLGSATGVLNIIEPSNLLISPPVLDAAFQGTLLAYSYPYDGQNWTIHVPGKVKRMSVNPFLCASEVAKAEPLPFDATHAPDMTALYANVDIYPSSGVENAIIQVEGLTCIPLSTASAYDDKEAFATIVWDVAAPDAQLAIEDSYFTSRNAALAQHLERLAVFYFRTLQDALPAKATSQLPNEIAHLLHYAARFDSFQRTVATTPWSDDWKDDTFEDLQLAGAPFAHTIDVQMLHAVGEAIGGIVTGEISASEVILNKDLLGRFHRDALGPRLYNKCLARILQQIAHRNSHMNLLEVGAGTGAATREILDLLGSSFASYTFTDISTGFFESAKQWSEPYTQKMVFKCLDASQDPISQGFAEQSYDVVVAALVLHATPVLQQTLQNLRRLLKPGGYLVVLELLPTSSVVYNLIFGSFSSWWLGVGEGRDCPPAVDVLQWDCMLRRTGFSGCDTATPARGDDCSSHFVVFASQAVDEDIAFLRQPLASPWVDLDNFESLIPRLVIIGGDSLPTLALVEQTRKLISRYCTTITTARTLADVSWSDLSADTTVLSLVDIDSPIFVDLDHGNWESLKHMLMTVGKLLWVTRGRLAANPHSNMMVGLLRSIIREVPTLSYRALDIEDARSIDAFMLSESLLRFQAEILWRHQEKGLSIPVENELVLNEDGRVMIPRVVMSQPMNDRYNSARRPIIGSFDRHVHAVAMVRASEGSRYELKREATSDIENAGGQTVIDVTYSATSAVRVHEFGCLFVTLGRDRASGRQVVTLASTHTSIVRPSEHLSVFLDAEIDCEATLMTSVVYKLLVFAVLDGLSRGDVVLIHQPDVGFAGALQDEAATAGIETIFVTSEHQDLTAGITRCLPIHPSTPDRTIARILPAYVNSFVDISAPPGPPSFGNRIRTLLPAHCRHLGVDDLLPSTSWVLPSLHHVESIRSRLEKAVKYGLAENNKTLVSAPVVPVQTLVDVDETQAPFSVFNWNGGAHVSAIIRPIDTQITFADQKTYWLAGLSGELGLALLRIAACDLTIREQVMQLHSEICVGMPPIAGVTQGANSWEDTAIGEMSLDILLSGTKPKVEGSINLNDLFQNDDLDFFVFFSSVVAVVGRPGQTYYSAANMFMAALAEQRRRKGLAASVIHIGPIYGIGYVARQEKEILNKERLRSSSLVPISEREFYQLFSEAVISGRSGIVHCPIELLNGVRTIDRHDNDLPVWATEPMMDRFIKNPNGLVNLASDAELKVPLKIQLAEACEHDRVYNIILEGLFPKLCNIFQIDSSNVDKGSLAKMRLDEIGIDSLLAVELRGWFMKTIEVNVPVLKILSGLPIGELVTFAVESLPGKFTPNLVSRHKADSEPPHTPVSDTEDQEQEIQTDSGFSAGAAVSSDTLSDISRASKGDLEEMEFNSPDVQGTPFNLQRTVRLSFSQQLLWFIWSFLENKSSLNHTAWTRIRGRISKRDFQRAFRLLSQQHEALRTRFIIENGQPMQAIMDSSVLELELGEIEDEDQVQQAVKMLKDEYVYDVERGMTARVMLLSRSPVEHFMVAGLHPFVADGFSFQGLLKGIQELYFKPDKSDLTETRQFAYHSEQQHMDLAAGKFDDDIQFWSHEFATIPPPLPILSLSGATHRPSITTYENENIVFRVSAATKQRIQAICRLYRATPFHFYLAAFRVLLLRYIPSGTSDDVVVGIGDANRTEDILLDVIGPLVNLLPVRLRASETSQFQELLQETRNRVYGALEHSRVPLQVLLNRLNMTRSALHTPLFQSFVNYRQGLRETTNWGSPGKYGPILSSIEIGIPKVAYDVSLEIVDYTDGECLQTLVVRKDMYSADHARLLGRSLELLIDAFVTDPALCLDQPVIFDRPEIQKVMEFSQGPTLQSQWPETVVHRIVELGRRHPDNVAAWHDHKTSTYEEILAKANAIAHALKAAQVARNSAVAVLQEASADWISSMLGIMQIGAAYLPLDLGQPRARLAEIISDCDPHVVLTDEENRTNISLLKRSGMKIIDVSSIDRQDEIVPILAEKDTLAAILYTSGSSGSPKGILLHHGALQNWAEPIGQLYEIGVETVLQQTSWSFDISLAQVLTALCFGGRLVLAPRQYRGDARAITNLMASQKITLVFSTPSEYKSWFNYGGGALNRATTWKVAFSGGEAMSESVVEFFRSLGRNNIRLYSLYGPGECATNATAMQVPLNNSCSPIAVGCPIPNYSVYVVDSKLRPVAVGVQGEIYIGGLGVGRGYIRDSKMTAQRFVQDVISSTKHLENGWKTLHRTGDLGRWGQDGRLLIEGRLSSDTQVKLRGYRIDMREVEHALIEAADGALLEAVVSKRDSTSLGGQFLIAHIVFIKEDGAVQRRIAELRTRLGLRLPAYMLPTFIISLDKIPMNNNGKLDRRGIAALPIPESMSEENDAYRDAGLTQTESQLKCIWQQVLLDQGPVRQRSITPDQDFFHIGGSSIHLLELQSRIKGAFGGLDIPLVEMFDSSTLSAMAHRIDYGFDTKKEQPIETTEWDMETALSSSLQSLPPLRACKSVESRAHVVVLTGATGQLGGAFLKAIIEDTNVAHVHCVGVRDAAKREDDIGFKLHGKVTLHAGDLYQPQLGLSSDDANRIFSEATIIVHSGADKSYQKSFTTLRTANLQTTKDLAIMAAAACGSRSPPDFHYISTASLGMLVADTEDGREVDEFIFRPVSVAAWPPPIVDSSNIKRTAHGYLASKWASEVFLERLKAQHPGWRIVIHRPGIVARAATPVQWDKEDDSTNGPVNDMLENLQYFAPRLRALPALKTSEVEISGVLDVVSLGEVIKGLTNSTLKYEANNHDPDADNKVEFIHHVSDLQLPLDNLGSWLGEAADIADGRDAWPELSAVEWARLAGETGMRPAVVSLFESVAAKKGKVHFYKASRM